MDRSDIIYLVSVTRFQDSMGVWREAKERKQVFCRAESVTRAEFFDGGRNGLKPEYRFTLFFGDYNGEQSLIYNGVEYAVYRTYKAHTDEIELYVQRKGGLNGIQENTGD